MSAAQGGTGAPASGPRVVSMPQYQKIVQDIQECIKQLKTDFSETKAPINDDNQILQRFCAKLEFLLQSHMKERYSMLGRKKDYWDYFVDILGSNKGTNDGIKYVKSLGEQKTSVGRGRAFLRFSLVHQRLPDTIQQCVQNPKTGDWFHTQSVWYQKAVTSDLINSLYDLTDVHFDLSPKGYDLDTAWPTFAKKQGGNYQWNPPSRRSSISSMASISMQDTSSLMSVPLYADNSGEVDKLTLDLETSHSVRSQLMEQVDSLQQEKMAASQSVWSKQGELSAVQDILRDLQEQHTELQDRYFQLEKRYDNMCIENSGKDSQWQGKEDQLTNQLQALLDEKKMAESQLGEVQSKLEDVQREMRIITEQHQQEVDRLDTERSTLRTEIDGLKKDLSLRSESDKKKSDQIEALEVKLKANEAKNTELLTKLELSLDNKETEANNQMEAASKLHDVVSRLKEVELANVKLQAANDEMTKKCEKLEHDLSIVEKNKSGTDDDLVKEREDKQKVEEQLALVTKCKETEVEDLSCKLKEKEEELVTKHSEIKELSGQISDLNRKSVEMDSKVVESYKQLRSLADDEAMDQTDGATLEYDLFVKDVNSMRESISRKMKSFEEEMKQISTERDQLKTQVASLSTEKDHVLENLDDLRKTFGEFQQSQESVQRDLDLQKNETESELREKVVEMESKKEEIQKLNGQLQEQTQQLLDVVKAHQLDQDGQLSSSQAVSLISLHVQKLTTRIADMEGEKSVLEGKLSHLQAGDADKGEQLSSLEENFTALQKSLGDAREIESKLRVELSEKDRSWKDECVKYEGLSKTFEKQGETLKTVNQILEETKTENMSLKERVNSLSHDLGELKVSLATTSEKLQSTSESKDKENHQQEKILKLREGEIAEKNEFIQTAKKKNDELESSLKEISEKKSNLEKDNITLQGDLKEMKSKLQISESKIQQLESDLEKGKQCQEASEEKIKNQNEDIQTLKQEMEDVKKDVDSREDKLKQMVQSHNTERSDLTSRLEEALTDTQSIQTQLQQTSQELEQACSLKERAEQEKEEVTIILRNLEASYRELKAKLNLFEEEGQEIASSKDKIEQERGQLQSEVDKLKENVERLESEKTASDNERDATVTQLKSELDDTKSKLVQVDENVQTLEDMKTNLEEKMREMELERDSLKESVEKSSSAMEEKQEENTELQGQVERLRASVSQLEMSLDEKRDECQQLQQLSSKQGGLQLQVESLTQEISALQFQLSSEQMQHEESLRSFTSNEDEMSEMTKKVTEQEVVIARLEQEVMSLENSHKEDSEKHKKELEVVSSSFDSTSEDKKKLAERLTELETELVTERGQREQLQSELSSIEVTHNEALAEKQGEITGLKSDMKQLKKQLLKLIRDKDTLWQKTDQLAYQQKVQAKETWMDNNTATNCLKCKSEFSIWLRRHHCRLCGKIFCWKCVDNWVMTAHSSKKERVCDECHSHKQSAQSEEANSSILSTQSDDSDDMDDDALLRSLTVRGSSQSTDDLSSTHESEPALDGDTVSQVTDPPGSPNATDEHKAQKLHTSTEEMDIGASDTGATDTPEETGAGAKPDDPFHLITDAEVSKSLTEYDSDKLSSTLSPNMCSSMILSAEDLERGEINSQNEVWVKPGKTFVVPINIDVMNTELCWEFTSQPKDIVFSVLYRESDDAPVTEAEELVPPCKCDSHKHSVQGTLTAKQTGLYTLVFDNTYSRMTAKKVHYTLKSTSNE